MTRQQKLDMINLKMARTSQSDEGTGCFLPVMVKDMWNYLEKEDRLRYMTLPLPFINKWIKSKTPLDSQDDDCIDYVYLLIK